MIKLADTLKAMSDFPVALADSIYFNDDSSLQEKFDNKELGGGDSSVTLTQEEYEALPEEEKLDGLYYTYDTKRIYKNGVQYGASEPIPLTMEEYKALKEAGAIDEKQEYLIEADAEGILLGAEDIGYNNAESGIEATTVQGAIDKVAEKADSKTEIDDISSSTTSTYSSVKIDEKIDGTTIQTTTTTGEEYYAITYGDSISTASNQGILIQYKRLNFPPSTYIFSATSYVTNARETVSVAKISNNYAGKTYDLKFYIDKDNKTMYFKMPSYSGVSLQNLAFKSKAVTYTKVDAIPDTATALAVAEYASISDTSTNTTSTWSSSKISSEITQRFPNLSVPSSKALKITRNSVSSAFIKVMDVHGNLFTLQCGDQSNRFYVIPSYIGTNLSIDITKFVKEATACYLYSDVYAMHVLEVIGDVSYSVIDKTAIPSTTTETTITKIT